MNDDINPEDFYGPHIDALAVALAQKEVRGLRADIYRDASYRSELNVFHFHTRVTLIGTFNGEPIAPVFPPDVNAPAIILGETTPGHVVAWPAEKGHRWLMFGGHFAYSSDSRWPTRRPIPLHDRYEGNDWEFEARA